MRKLLSVLAVTLLAAGTAVAGDMPTTGAKTGEYGSHCAWGLTMGKQVPGDCAKYSWTDTATHKTYCFSSEEAKTNFAKDTKTNVAKAGTEYSKVAGHGTATHN